jgi:hypothetical protein
MTASCRAALLLGYGRALSRPTALKGIFATSPQVKDALIRNWPPRTHDLHRSVERGQA